MCSTVCVRTVFKVFSTLKITFVFPGVSKSRSGRGGESEDDIQSATHPQIRLKGVGVARQEETLDAGHGEGSILAHPKGRIV